ncbi:glucosyltransferase Alg6 [Coprinopsis cinerea okayama7|uniref:Alpha-1,3-glucosyltransferase n=1 Tax=Coprinopsis cinerea (strain Okayama-7 / 130 / ATCC MYA-4618 / FGSC 9003) TaxID=240176 RepID=A8NRK6_COPC7|nr:glucosyltransferase Alg6 [Coprinopsis cinerea okayama7\|eukprot:XP_001835805.2 glucosyltransferase Alg6 [Coprinopsis cinerea okayama7\
MYGDYEAQRHWMELTTHLPFREWYTYDLQYWGLDYPPLTAYVSWMCGLIAHYLNPEWVALDASRGIETPGSKLFMRLSVVILDFLVYIPALVMFVRTWQGSRSRRTQEQAFLTLVLQPALLVIDHGHFQYNSVMLGFTLLAINFFTQGDDLYGAVCFVMSLGFKQMALYYAPAIGSYLLAKCIWLGWEKGLRLFIRLGATTVLSFGALFAPFFLPPFAPSVTHILHPITRIFPFNRGLFEDKVANFWCASNVAIKWKRLAISAAHGDEDKARGWLVKLSTLLTALGFSPSVVGILRSSWIAKLEAEADGTDARKEEPPVFISLLPYALLTSSMSFFLFSFQVHEKTILLPLLPLTLLMSAAQPGTTLHNWGALGNNVAVFSMWPLLKRDGQGLACVATLMLWNRAIGYNPFKWIQHKSSTIKENLRIASLLSLSFVQLVSLLAYAASICLVLLEFVLPVPKRYPDLFPVLNVLVSTPIFVLIWLWSIKCGLEIWWTLGGWSSTTSKKQTTSEKRLSASGPAVKPLEVKTSEGSGSSEVVGGSMDSPISI